MISNIINYLNSYKLFTTTLNVSISVQIISGLIEFFTLFISVNKNIDKSKKHWFSNIFKKKSPQKQ